MNELYHHGVKGMKWGVRRYQNKDGSLTPAGKKRAADYRDKELNKLDKRWSTDKLDKRISKNIDRYNEEPSGRLILKITSDKFKSYQRSGMKKAESAALRNMRLKDIENERRAVGAKKVYNALAVGGGYLIATNTGHGIFATTNIRNFKTNRRVDQKKRNTITNQAAVDAYVYGENLRNKKRIR